MIEIVLLACESVARAHRRGVIHGALTPGCVVLGRGDEVSVQQSTEPAELAGVAYYSTEQAWGRSKDVDERTDVYAFGGMLFLILTLRAPHDRCGDLGLELASARKGTVTTPQALCPDRALPRSLCRIATRALAASPSDRYPSIALFKQDLERFARGWATEHPIERPMRSMQSVSIARAPQMATARTMWELANGATELQ